MSAAVIVAADLLAGFLAWTLVEYAGHRWVMHGDRPNTLQREHRRHHRRPDNPPVVTSVIYGSVAVTLVAVSGRLASVLIGTTGALAAIGFAFGVVAYIFSHQMTHRGEDGTGRGRLLPPWRAHLVHHGGQPNKNFGFTTSFWDRVFRTRG